MKFSMLKDVNNGLGDNSAIVPARIRAAWAGRISGCLLGKPLEVLSFQERRRGVESYLRGAAAWPLRDYVPLVQGTVVERTGAACCRGRMHRAEPDDDINYTVLALLLLEEHRDSFDTSDVARAWLNLLPAGTTWTAERAAYRALLDNMDDEFVNGAEPGFDLAECSDNEYNEWIGAQIRADMYGWDTDCNGATVGGLLGLSGVSIPESWTRPWQGRVGISLAGYSELSLDELVARTASVGRSLH